MSDANTPSAAFLFGASSTSAISIGNTFGGQTITDVETTRPFNLVSVRDSNSGQTVTLTVTLSAAANGRLSNLSTGSYNATTGVYTVSGSAEAVATALDGLIFTPTYYREVSPGATVATTLTILATDTAGASVVDSTTTIITTETNLPLPFAAIRGIDYGPTPDVGIAYPSNAQIDADMAIIQHIGNAVRLYTVSNGMDYAAAKAISLGLEVIPSAYLVDPTNPAGLAANNLEIANLIAVLNNPSTDLSKIPFIDVGSDFLANNPTQYDYLAQQIQYVRSHIPTGIQVTTSESADIYSTTAIGSQVDVIFPTFSPFAQGGIVSVSSATAYFQFQYGALAALFATKNVVVSAIGWPSSGTNGNAIGSVANEEAFWSQFILHANQNKINYFGFEAFDSPTNTNPGFSGGDWGLYTTSGTPKGVVTSFSPAAPPQILGTAAGQTGTDATVFTPFANVAIADPNSNETETVTIVLSAAANGVLGNLGGGTYNATTGIYSILGSVASVTASVDSLIFVPTLHQVAFGQTVTTTFTISVSDIAGGVAVDRNSSTIVCSATAPIVIRGTASAQKMTDIDSIAPFSSVTISDPNGNATETVTVTLDSASNGTLSNLGAGTYNNATGVYRVTGSAVAVTAALNALAFVPTPHQISPGQSIATRFTIVDTDTAGATIADSTTTTIATATKDAIVISGVNGNQTATDAASIAPFSKITIDDKNAQQTETVTITLSSPANGTLTNLNGGTYNAVTGVYTYTGATVSAATAGIDGLVFTPTPRQTALGQTISTTFTITDTDTAGVSATVAVSVVVTAIAIQTDGAITLEQIGTKYKLAGSSGTGPLLSYEGSAIA
ncbi:MAG: hypothetical protein WCI94_09115, partial [Rhodospirillales bacterium]